MDTSKLTAVVTLLVALSVASERLVEIVKNAIPPLRQERASATWEAWRRCLLQALAIGAGIFTAWLAGGTIPKEVFDVHQPGGVFALGLLASGGSGFWNSILTYVAKVKDVKEAEVAIKRQVAIGQANGTTDAPTVKKWMAVATAGSASEERNP